MYILYQCQFSGYHILLWLYKIQPLGKVGQGYMGLVCTIFATSCEPIVISKQKVKINPKITGCIPGNFWAPFIQSLYTHINVDLVALFPELYLSVWPISSVCFSTAFN